jgi:hypothetical protein
MGTGAERPVWGEAVFILIAVGSQQVPTFCWGGGSRYLGIKTLPKK